MVTNSLQSRKVTHAIEGITVTLTLVDALSDDRLDEFIRQEETRLSACSQADFDAAVKAVIKSPPSANQTFHSPSSHGLRGK